jgi:hypothetical protein
VATGQSCLAGRSVHQVEYVIRQGSKGDASSRHEDLEPGGCRQDDLVAGLLEAAGEHTDVDT